MRKFILWDETGTVKNEIEAIDLDSAREVAREWARGGDYNLDEDSATIWVDTFIEDEDGDRIETVTIAIDPPAPRCEDRTRNHKWAAPFEIVGGISENPGVWGHGGGVLIEEVCTRCGCGRTIDTWATRMDNGEQGLTSTRYEAGRYTDRLNVEVA